MWFPAWRDCGNLKHRSAVRRYRVQLSEADTGISDEHEAMHTLAVHRCKLIHESGETAEPRSLKRTP